LAIGLVSAAVLLAGKASSAQELVAYNIVDEISIPKPLTDQPGDPVKGREVAINRKKGNCLACHVMPIPEQSFHGEIGPDLTGVGSRYKIGELRLRVVDPKTLNPDTMMPAFYRNDGTILGPQEVEDLLAYLMSLRDG
jgi:sulfur-oxidizing protein SoxX